MRSEIEKTKSGSEQELVVGPVFDILVDNGWNLNQIVFGKKEWRVLRTP